MYKFGDTKGKYISGRYIYITYDVVMDILEVHIHTKRNLQDTTGWVKKKYGSPLLDLIFSGIKINWY